MPALDTRLDWDAIEAVASGQTTTAPPAPPGLTGSPRTRLFVCLDTWATIDEDSWPEASVKALYEDIMDIF